jgi:hypothetical protein
MSDERTPEEQTPEEEIAELLGMLPPAPEGWVRAAAELPAARRAMDDLVDRAEADANFRRALLSDLERALRDVGVEPAPENVERLRERLAPEG